jgi:hypothetical protein
MISRPLPVLAFLCALIFASTAEAVIRPFVLAGGSTTRAEKTDLDEMLDTYTIREAGRSWETGGGLRFIPGKSGPGASDTNRRYLVGEDPIEIRLRFTLGGGGLSGTQFNGTRPDRSFRRFFPVSSRERFVYRSWALGVLFSARVYDSLGFFLGPVLQTVKYEADRTWVGWTDCANCGPAKDKATSRYGALEAGAHYTLHQLPLRLEGFWVPRRVNLTTTHIVQSENYKANFASLKGSFGARVVWEF